MKLELFKFKEQPLEAEFLTHLKTLIIDTPNDSILGALIRQRLYIDDFIQYRDTKLWGHINTSVQYVHNDTLLGATTRSLIKYFQNDTL